MHVQFTVSVTLRKEAGAFAGREEIVEQIQERLQDAAGEDVEGVGSTGESTYVVDDFTVEESTPAPRPRKKAVPHGS